MREATDDLSPELREILEDVRDHGLHVVYVPATDDAPEYAFTIGLWHAFEQPEVVVFGMPEEVAVELLETVADEVEDGRRFGGGERHEGLLVEYPVRFLELGGATIDERCALMRWAYEGAEVPAVQLAWPDRQGRWPWTPGVQKAFVEVQPVFGTPPK